MADVVFVAVVCAFFAICVVYIRWCDRIIGSDEFVGSAVEGSAATSDSDVSTVPSLGSGVTV